MNTRFILPSWWVKAYEATALAEAGDDSAMQQALAAGLSPAMSVIELNALAVILGGLQDQLLSGAAQLTVHPGEHAKHISTGVKTRRFAFEKVTQLLASLNILVPLVGGSTLESYKPFRRDTWLPNQVGKPAAQSPVAMERQDAMATQGDDWLIELTLNERGSELILGLTDAYADAIAVARGSPNLQKAVAGRPPLALWRSIWHELQGPEQLVLLRLERAMQWDFLWLTLEGTFGIPVRELGRGLRLSDSKGSDNELARYLKLLAKLGKKLTDHGFLAPASSDQYLALGGSHGAETPELILIWQMSRERLMADPLPDYNERVSRYFFGRYQAKASLPDDFFLLCHGKPLSASQMLYWREHWPKLCEHLQDSAHSLANPHPPLGYEALQPAQILSLPLLFMEWCLRSDLASAAPLPEALRQTEIVRRLGEAQVPVVGRFQNFQAALNQDSNCLRILREEPWASLGSPVTQADPSFKVYGAKLFVAPEFSRTRLEGARVQHQVADGLPLEGVENDAGAQPARTKADLSGALAARMRRTASDELQKMRTQFLDKYKDLQRAYLESLDEPGRKLLLDVQRRMQPTMFEEHLRQRLVRFMVENPGAWRSVEPPRGVSVSPSRLESSTPVRRH